ncbi:MAG: hypothetical protein P8Y64_10430 [Gammaproteobacteria bacterium]|jgi:intracellular sulfur oxidation DsrE/DsrF family protein
MNRKTTTEDMRLHAFIDNELDAADRTELLTDMEQDETLRLQVCDLRRTKELVQQAFDVDALQPPRRRVPRLSSSCGRYAVAATLVIGLMLASFMGGWYSRQGPAAQMPTGENGLHGISISHTGYTQRDRVLLHIASASHVKFAETLDQAQYLLKTYKKEGIKVEVIANSGGLMLLQNNGSAYSKRVMDLMKKYPNLSFVACHNAIKNAEKEGVKVNLIKDTKIAPSAIGEIIKRMRQGWVYIKI